MNKYDVIIVGACTAGTYFSNLLAKEGLKVLVIDKDSEENLCKRLDIFHFTRDSYKQFDIEESIEGDEEFVRNFDICYSRSAKNRHQKTSHTKVAVMHLPLFIKRLRNKAISNGVTFNFNESFTNLIYDNNNRICGITTNKESYYAKLVVDASGIVSVVRRKINSPYMENFEITPRDMFYVLLKYVKLHEKEEPVTLSTSWPYYKGWIAPQHYEGGAIIGVGANFSFDYARKCMAKFEENIPMPKYELQYEEMGCTPYRRPPFSFVSDNFMVIGDAACLTKPWNGEGIPSAWVQCTPAAKIVANALKHPEGATVENLWEINRLYQTGEGAEYASTRALLIGAVNMGKYDNDFLFKNNIVFVSDDEQPNPKPLKTLRKGKRSGMFSKQGFKSLISATIKSNKIKKHYLKYPTSPEKYLKWKEKASKLWAKAGTMADNIKDA